MQPHDARYREWLERAGLNVEQFLFYIKLYSEGNQPRTQQLNSLADVLFYQGTIFIAAARDHKRSLREVTEIVRKHNITATVHEGVPDNTKILEALSKVTFTGNQKVFVSFTDAVCPVYSNETTEVVIFVGERKEMIDWWETMRQALDGRILNHCQLVFL